VAEGLYYFAAPNGRNLQEQSRSRN